jgi:DNA polymerase III subunit beta
MKISCLQENLKRGLAVASHAVAGKSTLPVLSNVLLATDGGRLKIASTNLEIGLTHWIGAKVEEQGAITVPAKLFSDVVGGLPNDKIELSLDARTQTLNLRCARFESNIKGIEADEFPVIPTIAGAEPTAVVPSELLKSAIEQVAFAAAKDDSRPVLAGVLVKLRNNELVMVAADGFRLALRTIQLPEPVAAPTEMIVPARALIELRSILSDDDQVEMTVTPNGGQVLFHTPTTDLVSRLIEGRFPDYERIIPQRFATRTVLETSELLKAVKLSSYFALSSANIVKLTIHSGGDLQPGKLQLSANAAEVGDNKGEIDGQVSGEDGTLALDVRYLTEALGAIKTAQVALETQTAQSPGVFRPVGQEGYIHIVMPMTVR